MRAIVIPRHGGPGVLQVVERDAPEPGPNEVRVAVRAIGVNRADLLQCRGRHAAPPGVTPDVPGLELAGTVERIGSAVRAWRGGERVMCLLGGGAYAEFATVHEGLCAAVPAGLDWVQAAAVPESMITAWEALFPIGKLERGETVLVTAAASGVGTAAIQLAREAGARVAASSRTASKRERLEELGAHVVFDPAEDDWRRRIGPVDLVLDFVGGPCWKQYLELLASRGRLVVVGLLGGSRTELDLGVVLAKRLTISGTVLRPRSLEEKLALFRAWSEAVLPAMAAGKVRPIVDRVFPFEEAEAAHAHVESNSSFGRVVLAVGTHR